MRPADAARRRRLRLVRRGQHVLHRRAADGDLPHPALPLSRLPRVHQQAAVRPQARPRHAADRVRPGSAARQDRRALADRSGRAAPAASSRRPTRSPPTTCASARSASPSASGASSQRSDWTDKFRKLPHGRGVGLACSSYLSGAGLPIYWNDMPHSGVQLKLDRSGGVTAFCGATEIGQGSDDVLVGVRRGGARHRSVRRPRRHRRHRSHAGRSRLVLEPRHADDGQRRDPGGRARARPARRRRSPTQARASRATGSCSPTAACSTPRTRRRGVTFQRGGRASPKRCSARSARPARTRRRSPPAKFKGGGVGPSPTYSYTAAVVEVEVDPETGWITVPRVWIAHDIGRALNPTLVRGQVEGSVYMGLGEALMEEQAFRRLPPRLSHALVHKFPSMLEYKSPTTPRHAGGRHRARRGSGSARARSARRKSGRGRCCRSCRRSPTRSTTPSACASTRCRSRRRRSCKALDAKARGQAAARTARRRSPTLPWPEPLLRAAAVGRRRRPRVERAERRSVASRRRRRSHGGGAVMMRLPRFRTARRARRRGRGAGSPSRPARRCSSPAAPICCRT